MPPGGFKVGDRIRLPDGDTARVVADRPQRTDRRANICFLRDRHPPEDEEAQYESGPVSRVTRL